MVGRSRSRRVWLWKPSGPGTFAGLLVGKVRVQGLLEPVSIHWILVLVPAHWQAEPGHGVWLQCPGVPELMSDCCVELVPDTAD